MNIEHNDLTARTEDRATYAVAHEGESMLYDAHVRAYRAHFECPACAIAGGYCGASCNGAHNWFRGPSR